MGKDPKDGKKKGGRGGKRIGAGRPKGTSRLYAFRADKEVADYIDRQENKTDFIRGCIIKKMATAEKENNNIQFNSLGTVVPATRVKPLHLPFFDVRIVAGFPIPLDNDERAQDIELLHMLCPHSDATYLIRVQGYSMIDANINDGDILIVDKSNREPTENEVAVCELNGEYTVKRVQHDVEGNYLEIGRAHV